MAVFPFEDLSIQQGLGIFCRSFSSDLVTELSKFRQFQVISQPEFLNNSNSSDQLQTDYFIQGSFRYEKEIVRINVQLYNTQSRHLVWGNRLEGKLEELGEIQDNLLASVVGILQQQINLDLLSRIKKRPTVAFNAYELWLRGMEELKMGSLENDLAARSHFEKALEIQPDYSLAHSGMSLSYFNEWSCQLWERWDISKTGAYDWAQKALELDDQNYIAAMVAGRIYLYEGSYDTAEFYFRKSLLQNPNDPDTLIQIAMSFVFLGLGNEAAKLYEKAIQLNPLHASYNYFNGAFIYFELGQFEKAASLIKQAKNVKVADAEAYNAAIYFHLQQYDKAQTHWNLFLDNYRRLITKGKDFSFQEAANWLMQINPHRFSTNLEPFFQYISKNGFEKFPTQKKEIARNGSPENYFLKEADIWKLSFDGSGVQLQELKGFYDIQKLLNQPGQLFHCAELMGSTMNNKGEKLIDEKARKQYQKRILELQNDLQEAEKNSDFIKVEKLQEEYDQLIEYLSKSLGLKGKARETGNAIEKARSAITWRIRNAIARVEQHHPLLGAHLSNSIKTGTLCAYQPDRSISWILS